MDISFIVCTYNPDVKRLNRVLQCIDLQETQPGTTYEIVLVDNRSSPPVSNVGEVQNLSIYREPQPGLTHARRAGFLNSSGSLLVFVDDDNFIEPDYLRQTMLLAERHPAVGVFSAGQILPEYEVDPPEEVESFWPFMALTCREKESWTNQPNGGCLPMGAGMVVRRSVMQEYIRRLGEDETRLNTDRDGVSLFAGGDTDIGIVACGMSLGVGYFPVLKLSHAMPAFRLTREYLQRLVSDVSYSTTDVMCRGGVRPASLKAMLRVLTRLGMAELCDRGRAGLAKRLALRGELRAVWKNYRSRSHVTG